MDEVLTERHDQVLLVTLNRPEARNSVNTALAEGLVAAMALLDDDPDLRAGVVTGAGKGFSAGMDLKAFAAEGTPRGFERFLRDGSRKPVIAAVEGFAVAGGLEIALTCDLIVAGRDARLGIPEAGVGLFAAGGGLYRLPSRIPYATAMEMALTAEPISAERAAALGLVSRLADPGGAVAAAMELAARIARNAPLAVAVSKELIRASAGRTEEEFWAIQEPLAGKVFTSGDAMEGAIAFAERRPPEWRGA
jgi:enoyl-CoA hydratase